MTDVVAAAPVAALAADVALGAVVAPVDVALVVVAAPVAAFGEVRRTIAAVTWPVSVGVMP